jgi:Mlc titration factor MtfA (ptsG expression regulator)
LFSLLRQILAPRSTPIAPHLWEAQLRHFPRLQQLTEPAQARLHTLCEQFLAKKSITGAAGLVLTAPMELHIAAQACLPILHLGLHWYRGWSGIVVYPARFRVHRRVVEDSGIAHESDDVLSGEAWDGGPVVLSWADSAPYAGSEASRANGSPGADPPGSHAPQANVVIHEFAHTLDLLDGDADGIPPFDRRLHPALSRSRWASALDDAYARFCEELDLIESELPGHVDPDSADADAFYARLPLDPYAATDPAEFFAVSSEALFMDAARLRASFPAWHGLLRHFYRLDAAHAQPADHGPTTTNP